MCGTCTLIVLFIGAVSCVAALPMEDSKRAYETQLTNAACELQNNQTLKASFQNAVRLRYGITDSLGTNRYNLMRINVSSSVKCFEVCPNSSPSDVTWCIYIYHPTEYVSLCLNTTGVIYETYVAALLLLEKNFVVKQCDRPSTYSTCLWTIKTPYYLNGAYLVCTSQTRTCIKRTFVDNVVDANKATIEITQFPVSPMSAISGRSATLKCNATAGSSIGYIQWTKGSTAYYPIHEDPYCSSNYGCLIDTLPDAAIAKLQRVRLYSMYESHARCGETRMDMISYLVIDNVTAADAGIYTCSAETLLPYPTANKSASLVLSIG